MTGHVAKTVKRDTKETWLFGLFFFFSQRIDPSLLTIKMPGDSFRSDAINDQLFFLTF